MPAMGSGQPSQGIPQEAPKSGVDSIANGIMASRAPRTSYMDRLSKRSTPSMEGER